MTRNCYTIAHFHDLAYFTPPDDPVGLTLDEAHWLSARLGDSRMVTRHLAGGPRLTICGRPVTIIPDNWQEAA